jgi:hypothetical protein
MRSRIALVLLGIVVLLFAMAPSVESQGRSKGGFSGGGLGGFDDPNRLFEMMSRGRGFFVISETRKLNEPLAKFAEANRITNGQITYAQFMSFWKVKDSFMAPRPAFPGPAIPVSGGPTTPMGSDKNLELISSWAEADFKRRDRSDDGYLNMDEVPDALRADFNRWDSNGDGLISLNEYRPYFVAQFSAGRGEAGPTVTTIIDDEDLDKRPVVFRAGKLPKELPSWFQELDLDKDGQVALWEWRKGGKDIDDFRKYDFNDDGLITAEEAMQQLTLTRSDPSRPTGSSGGPPMGKGKWKINRP